MRWLRRFICGIAPITFTLQVYTHIVWVPNMDNTHSERRARWRISEMRAQAIKSYAIHWLLFALFCETIYIYIAVTVSHTIFSLLCGTWNIDRFFSGISNWNVVSNCVESGVWVAFCTQIAHISDYHFFSNSFSGISVESSSVFFFSFAGSFEAKHQNRNHM